VEITITSKIRIYPSEEQIVLLKETRAAYTKGCNFVSELVFEKENVKTRQINDLVYYSLRGNFGLLSQMTQSVVRTVVARYKTNKSNGHARSLVKFKRFEYDLVRGKDYSFKKNDTISIGTLNGRTIVPFETKGMSQFLDGSWKFGTAKLVNKHNKWFIHIPVTKEIVEFEASTFKNIVGIDVGVNFIATSYDSNDKTLFFSGKQVKHKRAKYKKARQDLQKRQTPSARRKLKQIGDRENRWMTDVNHQVSKALVKHYGKNTLFVMEDLTGIRSATEKVRLKHRYLTVSWAFFQLRQMMDYKAKLNQSLTIFVDPKYSSQQCPKCKHTARNNRDKKKHLFSCKKCVYRSNDDRIGAMNMYSSGIQYIAKATGV
jgi:IS605 OrfB family transposase